MGCTWLALHTERPGLPWTFAVIEADSYNAFTAPDGYIFVTGGLFGLFRTESELVGVLSRERGPILERHHLVAIHKIAQRGLATNVLSELSASQSQSLLANKQIFSALVDSGMPLYANGLHRDDEYESDRLGEILATRAGYEPFGLPGLLLALMDLNKVMTAWHSSTPLIRCFGSALRN